MGRPIENIIGEEFGDFEVIELTKDPNGKDTEHTFWKCRCKICGEIRIYPKYYLAKRKEIKCKSTTLKVDNYNTYVFYKDYIEVFDKNGSSFKIDIEDYKKVKQHNWKVEKTGYVINTSNKNKNIRTLHRFLLNPPKEKVVDHINHDTTDNRKQNLRICSFNENCQNRSMPINNTSGIIGVRKRKTKYGEYWRAQIKINGKMKTLGEYKDKEKAIKKRLQAEKEYFGDFAPQKELFEKYGI